MKKTKRIFRVVARCYVCRWRDDGDYYASPRDGNHWSKAGPSAALEMTREQAFMVQARWRRCHADKVIVYRRGPVSK